MFYRRRTDVRVQHVDGETLVLDEQNGYVHQFNHTASFILRQCDGQTSTADMAINLVHEFGLDRATAARDVSAVIDRMLELRLISDDLGER